MQQSLTVVNKINNHKTAILRLLPTMNPLNNKETKPFDKNAVHIRIRTQ